MPIYEYRCEDCGQEFELFQKITAPAGGTCPSCGSTNVRRLISLSNFHLKGSGWYVTDYSAKHSGSSSNDNGSKSDSTASSGESSSKSGTEAETSTAAA